MAEPRGERDVWRFSPRVARHAVDTAEARGAPSPAMDPKDFRAHAHAVVDVMADYLEHVGDLPVVPAVQPGAVRDAIAPSPPMDGEPFAALMHDFREVILPGMTHWNHPSFFAYFPANHSPPSILAEMLTAAMGAQCMSWQTSPAATELEQVTMSWLRQMAGLPAEFTGVIQDSASSATLVAILSARERATKGGWGREGASAAEADKLVVYASREAHSSIDKGVKLAGLGLDRLRHVDVDEAFAMRPDALAARIREDVARGLVPACVVATVGTTSSTAVDPLVPIAAICKEHGAWLHVDAAYAGSAAILPEKRAHFEGLAEADSFVFNPHKWLFTNFDCSAYFVKDTDALLRACAITPEYLKTTHDAAVVNYRDWQIPLGRRFRALKLWFVIRSFGVEGLRTHLRRHIALADELRGWIAEDARFEVVAPSPFALVCLRLRADDDANARVLAKVNATGKQFLTHTRLGGRYVIRVSIGQLRTEREHVRAAWDALRAAADEELART